MNKADKLKQMKKFNKSNTLIGALSVLLIASLVTIGFLYTDQKDLKGQLDSQIEKASASDNSLDSLRSDIAELKKELSASTKQLNESLPSGLLELPELPEFPTIEPPAVDTSNTVRSPSMPNLEVNPKTVNLGTISQADGVVKSNYNITNSGGSDLKIYSTFSSCGCTTVPLKNKIIKAGESVDLEVAYDPNYFKGALGLGEIEKTITIISNDPINPFLKVNLIGVVIP